MSDIPSGYSKLAVIGIAYKGDYDSTVTYKKLNAVYYDGSTYVALIDSPVGTPSNDGTNWKYLAKGFLSQTLADFTALDAEGLLGTVGANVDAQDLVDKIAEILNAKEDSFTKNTAFNKDFETSVYAISMDGTASVGTSSNVARADHVHPSDTTKLNTNGDAKDVTVTFTSADKTTDPSYTAIEQITSGETEASLMNKMSQMAQNQRMFRTMMDTVQDSSKNLRIMPIATGYYWNSLVDESSITNSDGNVDLDLIKTNGIANTIDGWANIPSEASDGWGTLCIIAPGGNDILQVWYGMNQDEKLWWRKYRNSWSTWRRIASIDDVEEEIDTNIIGTNDTYDSSTSYTVGAYCIYNNALWKCLVACSGQTPSEGTYWTKVSLKQLSEDISELNSRTEISVSWSNSNMNNTTYPLLIMKQGQQVSINSTILVTADISSDTTLISAGGIPNEYRPYKDISINSGGIIFIFYQDGSVLLQNISSTLTAGYHVISGTYFTD